MHTRNQCTVRKLLFELTLSFPRVSHRHLTIVNRKVRCSFTCDHRSTCHGLSIFIISCVLYMRGIFLWCLDDRWVGPITASECKLRSICFIHPRIRCCTCVHYIEVCLQWESIGRTETCFQTVTLEKQSNPESWWLLGSIFLFLIKIKSRNDD
jgi:hypothetical protein